MSKRGGYHAYVVLVVHESGDMQIRIFSSPAWGLTRLGNWPMYAQLMPESEGDSFEQAARTAEEHAEQWLGRAQGHLFAWRKPKEPPQHLVAEPVQPFETVHDQMTREYLRRTSLEPATYAPSDSYESYVGERESIEPIVQALEKEKRVWQERALKAEAELATRGVAWATARVLTRSEEP